MDLGAGTGSDWAPCTDACIYDLRNCSNPSECGDGTVESPEVCEPGFDPEPDCEDVFDGYVGGELGCTDNCTYDTTQCIPCTDNAIATCTPGSCCPGTTCNCQPIVGCHCT